MKNQVIIVGAVSKVVNANNVLVDVKRDSGVVDTIPVTLNCNVGLNTKDNVIIKGRYMSKNENKKLVLYVLAESVSKINYDDSYNSILLQGYLVKTPTFRLTPNGREISDVIVGNEKNNIPCVFWGKNARVIKRLNTGDCIRIVGRIQSRQYKKENDIYTAYEVSVTMVEIIDILY